MTASFLLAMALTLCGRFTVDTLPLPSPGAQVILVGLDADKVGDIAFLDKSRLTIYPSAASTAPVSIDLGEGVTAFDLADLTGDGNADVLAVRGNQIVRIRILDGASQPQTVLFERPSLLSRPGLAPYSRVLVVQRGLRPLIALPQADGLEFLTLDGVLDMRLPASPNTGATGARFRAFNVSPAEGKLEWDCEEILQVDPVLPVDLQGPSPNRARQRKGTPSQMIDVAEKAPVAWPWFPLRTRGDDSRRVLYAAAPPQWRDTTLRVAHGIPAAENTSTPGESPSAAPGVSQVFPGMLLLPADDLPDFNRDGYTDVALWQSPFPGASFDALFRAATGGMWDVRVSVYLFDPEKSRYAAAPATSIRTQAPVPWFMPWESWSPLRNLVFRDLNGDGRTDCAWSTAANRFAVWIYEDGFPTQPTFEHTFSQPVQAIEFRADLNGDGATAIGLRSEQNLFVLRWTN